MLRFTNIDITPKRLPPVYAYRRHPLVSLRQALDPFIGKIGDLDYFIQIAKQECHFPSEHGLTQEESAAIYLYTMDWGEDSLYRLLNKVLREEDRSVLVPWNGYIKLFDTAINKLPSCQINLWRGIDLDISKNYAAGQEITWWYFSSCSSALNAVKHFLGPVSTLFMIEARNAKDISSYSNYPNEKELVLGLGTRIRVAADVLDHTSLTIIHLTEISTNHEGEINTSFSNMTIQPTIQTNIGEYLNLRHIVIYFNIIKLIHRILQPQQP